MARCAEHPDRDTVGRCAGCGRPVCEECVEITDESGGVYCYDCAVSSQLAVIADREREEAAVPAPAAARRRRFGTWTVVALVVLCLAIAAEVTYIAVSRSQKKARAEVSAAQEVVYGRDRCAMNMQAVREELEVARKEAGEYPAALQQLADREDALKAACTLTGAAYVYESRGTDYELACPNPVKHGAGALSATSTSVPHATGE